MARLKFLVYSKHGTALFIARRLEAEGHSCRFYVDEPAYRFRGRGLVETTRDPEPQRGEIVIIDEDGYGEQAARWRRRGHLVLGGNAEAEKWETDRSHGAKIMERGRYLI